MSDTVAEHVEVHGGIVVGDDGSACAQRAVQWAAAEARLRGCPLHVLRAWHVTTAPQPVGWQPGVVPSLPEFERAVRDDLEHDVATLLGPDPGIDVRRHVVHRGAARALVDASRNADLVVVGSRGRGGFTGLLLGSTSSQVVHHANCPVVVIREEEETELGPPPAGE